MTFLAEIVPGLREIRSPLIGGYAWIVAVVFVLGRVPEIDTDTAIRQLAATVGPVVVGAAVSLIAYLVGSMIEDIYSPLLGLRAGHSLTSLAATTHGFIDTRELDQPGIRRKEREGRFPRNRPIAPSERITADDLLDVATTSQKHELDRLESQIDRLNAEALLRLSVALPLSVAFVALTFREHPLWALGTLLVLALGLQFAQRRRRALDLQKASKDILRAVITKARRPKGTAP